MKLQEIYDRLDVIFSEIQITRCVTTQSDIFEKIYNNVIHILYIATSFSTFKILFIFLLLDLITILPHFVSLFRVTIFVSDILRIVKVTIFV